LEEGAQRLQKILASAGYGSRRACEEIVRQGRVSVNGQQAKLGDSADPAQDTIMVDGRRIHVEQSHTYILVYKPKSVIGTMRDERGRRTVRDLVPVEGHLMPVGRLDADSEGLMLLTDDGELTYRLTHPRYEHEKEYKVWVMGRPDEAALNRWRHGVDLADFDDRTSDGGRTLPAQVEVIHGRDTSEGTWLRVTMREGRKRQIRRVASLLGHPVHQLIRVRIGPLRLGNLKPGQWRHLTSREIEDLKSQVSNLKPGQQEPASKTRNPKPKRGPR
jgi:23S rRNA pseudouridine2605 synthase